MGEQTPGLVGDKQEVAVTGAVLAVVRDLYAAAATSVPARTIRSEIFARFGIRYDAVNRALRELTETDLVWKPKRGYYEPTFRERDDGR